MALVLAGLSLATLAALLVGGSLGELVFALAAVWLPVALMALGAPPSRLVRALLVTLALVLAASALAVRLLSAQAQPYRAGLPDSAWIMLVGLGLVPFLIVVLGYAFSFDRPARDGRPDG